MIETISADINVSAGTQPIVINAVTFRNGVCARAYFPATDLGSSVSFFGEHFAVNQLVRLYAGAGTALSNTTTGHFDREATGYLINTP